VGDVFEGAISSVTGFGVFVQVDDPFVEGLIRIDQLSDDYYNYDEAACRLVGRRSGRAFALGDSVKVEVQSVSVVRRKVDFALAGHAAREQARGEHHGRGERGREKKARHGREARRAGADQRGAKRTHARADKDKGGRPGKPKGKTRR
jgi:ribonuclease R